MTEKSVFTKSGPKTGTRGAIPVIAVASILEERARLVVAIDERRGEPRRDSLDNGHLPIAEQGVRSSIPIVAELSAATEREIVDHAAYETVIEIDLRQRPIQVLPVGEREVRSAQ